MPAGLRDGPSFSWQQGRALAAGPVLVRVELPRVCHRPLHPHTVSVGLAAVLARDPRAALHVHETCTGRRRTSMPWLEVLLPPPLQVSASRIPVT